MRSVTGAVAECLNWFCSLLMAVKITTFGRPRNWSRKTNVS